MSMFLINILLALAWTALSGNFTPSNFAWGFLLGYIILVLLGPVLGLSRYTTKVFQIVSFVTFFMQELVLSNLRVALDVATPGYHMKPGVLAIPLDVTTDVEITLLANLITLTPGTLTLDVSDDRKVLYIHAMFLDDPEAVRSDIKNGFERRILELFR